MSQPAVAADHGPMARLEDVKRDEGAAAEVFRLLTDPEGPGTLREIAKAWRVPRGRFVEWFTTEHAGLYDAALKVRADELAHGALSVAATPQPGVIRKTKSDGSVEVTEEDMLGHRKLHTDTMLKLAEKWDRARYGAQVKVEHAGSVVVDAGLLGTIGNLLAAAREKRLPVTIEAVPVPEVDRHPPELARPPAEEPDLI